MFGDIVGGPAIRTVVRLPNGATRSVFIPQVNRGGFKIADNESPRPTDRVFVTYNYYNNVNTLGGPNFDLHREMIGFEKTFFDGNASIGMRLPFLQLDGLQGVDDSLVGDLSIIFKWAFLNDLATGNLLSAGMVVTVPSGDDIHGITNPTIHPTILQPYVGGIYNAGDLYVHGFSSLAISTDSRDVTFWSNDIAVGYWLYRNKEAGGLVHGIAPTLEAHVFTPLNHRNSSGDVFAPDWVVLTGGVYIDLGKSSTLGIAVATPVTGPHPFDVEAIVSFNVRF
jgi:hypothetical protein